MDIPTVPVNNLHAKLGFQKPINYPATSLIKPLTDWKMEIDDAPIFRYIYRNFQPHRHLEFGTWQGSGVLYCLEECNATVWTINLLEGEKMPDGSWVYHDGVSLSPKKSLLSRLFSQPEKYVSASIPAWANIKKASSFLNYQTDALGFIGRYYHEAKQGHRVCQIYCNSCDWDIQNYPPGFFDTALLDGGHSEEVVLNDMKKANQLVRSGGLIMWHDFCLDQNVQNNCSSTTGVFNAIKTNWDWLTEQMSDIFWIHPSWILIGVKK